jgi:hypothetical protein
LEALPLFGPFSVSSQRFSSVDFAAVHTLDLIDTFEPIIETRPASHDLKSVTSLSGFRAGRSLGNLFQSDDLGFSEITNSRVRLKKGATKTSQPRLISKTADERELPYLDDAKLRSAFALFANMNDDDPLVDFISMASTNDLATIIGAPVPFARSHLDAVYPAISAAFPSLRQYSIEIATDVRASSILDFTLAASVSGVVPSIGTPILLSHGNPQIFSAMMESEGLSEEGTSANGLLIRSATPSGAAAASVGQPSAASTQTSPASRSARGGASGGAGGGGSGGAGGGAGVIGNPAIANVSGPSVSGSDDLTTTGSARTESDQNNLASGAVPAGNDPANYPVDPYAPSVQSIPANSPEFSEQPAVLPNEVGNAAGSSTTSGVEFAPPVGAMPLSPMDDYAINLLDSDDFNPLGNYVPDLSDNSLDDLSDLPGQVTDGYPDHQPALEASEAVIPEPSTIAIWSLLGLAGLGYGWRKRRKA